MERAGRGEERQRARTDRSVDMGHPPPPLLPSSSSDSCPPCASPRQRAARLPPLLSFTSGLAGASPLRFFLSSLWQHLSLDLRGKDRKREREERKRDEVSLGPVPSLLLGTYNLGKELRGEKGRDGRMGRGWGGGGRTRNQMGN